MDSDHSNRAVRSMQSTLRMQNWLENDKDFNDDSDMDPDFVENEDLPENILNLKNWTDASVCYMCPSKKYRKTAHLWM